jgi:hypothetical protein
VNQKIAQDKGQNEAKKNDSSLSVNLKGKMNGEFIAFLMRLIMVLIIAHSQLG